MINIAQGHFITDSEMQWIFTTPENVLKYYKKMVN